MPAAVLLGLVLAAAVAVHAPSIGTPFFADDYLFLEQVRGRSLPAALAAPDPIGNFYRPLGRQLHFWTLARLTNESPAAFHATNLALFLASVALLFWIARRLAGLAAAVAAAAVLALHYAADVPLRWASGSQDLWALALALGAIALHLGGRRAAAAIAMLLALLAKETVVLTPLIAAVAAREPATPWRRAFLRAWPLAVAVAVWASAWVLLQGARATSSGAVSLAPTNAAAALVHLVHVFVGVEWAPGGLRDAFAPLPPLGALLAAIAVVLTFPALRAAGAVRTGLVWAAAGALPVAAAAPIWSAYYYLFAVCGAALATGAIAARLPRVAAAGLVVLLAWGSAGGRAQPTFAAVTSPWAWQSHVNARYVERATERIARYLRHMRRARPTLPAGSTVFFAGVPSWIGWQVADGPLLRWAYRDTSLRSYYLAQFSAERVRRGTPLFFYFIADSLYENPANATVLMEIGQSMLLEDRLPQARDAYRLHLVQRPGEWWARYALAWIDWAEGDTLSALGHLRGIEAGVDRGPAPELPAARAAFARGDTLEAIRVLGPAVERHALDGPLHGLLADLMMATRRSDVVPRAQIESYAARVLEPDSPEAWLRWGQIQAMANRPRQAVATLERYLALDDPNPDRLAHARSLLAAQRRILPGGDLAREDLRGRKTRR